MVEACALWVLSSVSSCVQWNPSKLDPVSQAFPFSTGKYHRRTSHFEIFPSVLSGVPVPVFTNGCSQVLGFSLLYKNVAELSLRTGVRHLMNTAPYVLRFSSNFLLSWWDLIGQYWWLCLYSDWIWWWSFLVLPRPWSGVWTTSQCRSSATQRLRDP